MMAEHQTLTHEALSIKLRDQERYLGVALGEVSRKVNETLEKSNEKSQTSLSELRERLATIDGAQKNIMELSKQVVSLQDVLANKQARGAFGEVQLNDLVSSLLPPSVYQFQATLEKGTRADCLLNLPNPPGSIVIDAKFPLESYHALQAAKDPRAKEDAARSFRLAFLKHIKDISEKYIVPGETADSALMFLPSEAVYAELHSNFLDVVDKSYAAKVWVVSPTTLMATLTTIRAVLKDVEMREQAGRIQIEVGKMVDDITRLDQRVRKLGQHFAQVGDDVQQIQITTGKVLRRTEKIGDLQFDEDESLHPPQLDTLNRRLSNG